MISEFSEKSVQKNNPTQKAVRNVTSLVGIFFLLLGFQAQATSEISPSVSLSVSDGAADVVQPEARGYYFVHDQISATSQKATSAQSETFQDQTFIWVQQSFETLRSFTSKMLDLLDWDYINDPVPVAAEKYNRKKHYGGWIVDTRRGNCYDTRGLVLIRDSQVPISNSPSTQCRVAQGQWLDPYSGQEYTSAQDIQIDHVVALKNSYISGAFEWDYHKRCVYANFMGNNFHLLAASGDENMRKLDYSPERWMPKDPAYRCQHLWNWMTIKMIWHLRMTTSEAQAIKDEIQKNNCDINQLKYQYDSLLKQRDIIDNSTQICNEEPTALD